MDIWVSIVHILEIAMGVILSSVLLDVFYSRQNEEEYEEE